MTTISIAVGIKHASFAPERAGMLMRLRRQLGRSPSAPIVVTRDAVGIGGYRAFYASAVDLLRREPGATHYIMLDDDVQVCGGFLRCAEQIALHQSGQAAEALRLAPIAFFCQLSAVHEAAAAGKRWLSCLSITSPALMLPAETLIDFLQWWQIFERHAPQYRIPDGRLSMYLTCLRTGRTRAGITCLQTVPSLAEHGDPAHPHRGLCGHKPPVYNPSRTAQLAIASTMDASALDFRRDFDAPYRAADSPYWRKFLNALTPQAQAELLYFPTQHPKETANNG